MPKTTRTARHAARATRDAGRQMRSALLDAASALFKRHGLNGTSMTAIATAADAFPSQVTYYFRSKEALFVEAACRDVLYLAQSTEQAAIAAETPATYTQALVTTAMAGDALPFFVEALTVVRRRPDLVPLIERTFERLHAEGARAYGGQMVRHGWQSQRPPEIESRRFWTIALGTALEGYATGRSAEASQHVMLQAIGQQAAEREGRARLQLVAPGIRASQRKR